MKFSDFNLSKDLLSGLNEAGYIECTPVQEASLQAVIDQGRDVYAQSQTGTGKTAAFLVPILQLLLQNDNEDEYALVLTPTRELALQVEKEARLLAKNLSLKIVHILGGVEYAAQEKGLKDKPRLIIGTPGRLQDFVNQNILDLKKAKYLVVDEADRMFDMGFQNDVLALITAMRGPKERISLLFSATLNPKVGNLVWEHMNNPVDIVIEPEQVTVDAIDQEIYHVGRSEKLQLLFSLIRHYQPRNMIIFSNTKVGAAQIARFFSQMGMTCGVLEGNMPQAKRTRVINNLTSGKLAYLAATDVAARGIHVPDLDWVVNFDLPNEAENYVHRIGRTARAGRTGKAVSFACERYVYNLSAIESLIGKKIPVAWPDDTIQALMMQVEQELKQSHKKSLRFEGQEFSRRGKNNVHHKKKKIKEMPKTGIGTGSIPVEAAPKKGKSHYEGKRTHHREKSDFHAKEGKKDRQYAGKDLAERRRGKGRKRDAAAQNKNVHKGRTAEERMKYYKEKYGEDFRPAGSGQPASHAPMRPADGKAVQKKKRGLVEKIFSLFRKDN